MQQVTEKQQEMRQAKTTVTVMFYDRMHVLGGSDSFRVRESAVPSLPSPLAVISCDVSDASSQPALLTLAQQTPSPDRTQRRSLSHTEKFSAEEQIARSALAVLAANPNTRSLQAAATVITTMTEQRCCAAA